MNPEERTTQNADRKSLKSIILQYFLVGNTGTKFSSEIVWLWINLNGFLNTKRLCVQQSQLPLPLSHQYGGIFLLV